MKKSEKVKQHGLDLHVPLLSKNFTHTSVKFSNYTKEIK